MGRKIILMSKYTRLNNLKRLFEFLENNSAKIPEAGCWLWLRGVQEKGYGILMYEGRNQRTHRLMWKAVKGDIPIGKLVCHTCDIPCCVNPYHLWLGTPKENSEDMSKKGRVSNQFLRNRK